MRLAQRISCSISGVISPSPARYTGTAYIITCIIPKPATNTRHSAARRSALAKASLRAVS